MQPAQFANTALPSFPPSAPAISTAMRSGIPDPQSREQTITLYVDKVALGQALGLPHEHTIYVLLVDREGHLF